MLDMSRVHTFGHRRQSKLSHCKYLTNARVAHLSGNKRDSMIHDDTRSSIDLTQHVSITDEENSLVHGIVTSDGLFDGTVITGSGDEIYIEPTGRYAPTVNRNIDVDDGTQHVDDRISHHTIAYRSSDVATPIRNQQPCRNEILRKNDPALDILSQG